MAHILDIKRAKNSLESIVKKYFINLQQVVNEFVFKANQIYNCNETGVCPQGRKPPRVICHKGLRANVQRTEGRENTSIMECANDAGKWVSPMYIFKGKRRQAECMDGSVPGSVCAVSDSSCVNRNIFLHWLMWFKGYINTEERLLLIVNRHYSHVTWNTLQYAKSSKIELFVLPSHTLHFL